MCGLRAAILALCTLAAVAASAGGAATGGGSGTSAPGAAERRELGGILTLGARPLMP